MTSGRWSAAISTDLDVERRARVMVMGWKFADSLFGNAAAALGQIVNIGGKAFTVVGVIEREEFRFAAWSGNALEYRNERAYIPISTAFSQFAGNEHLSFMTLKAKPGMVPQAVDEVRSLLYARHGVEDFDIRPSGSFGGGDSSAQFMLLFNFIFLVVGTVSLFTGGIVIANILLASVVERVREFGTRMALGATAGGDLRARPGRGDGGHRARWGARAGARDGAHRHGRPTHEAAGGRDADDRDAGRGHRGGGGTPRRTLPGAPGRPPLAGGGAPLWLRPQGRFAATAELFGDAVRGDRRPPAALAAYPLGNRLRCRVAGVDDLDRGRP